MSGTGSEVAQVLDDMAKKAGPALAHDFAGAYQKILHETADGLEGNAKRVVDKEGSLAKDFGSIGKDEPKIPKKPGESGTGGGHGGEDGGGSGKPPATPKKPGEEGEPGDGQPTDGNGKCETGSTDPVDVVSGQVLLTEIDVDLPGLLPLLLRRAYASAYPAGRLFGPGWSSTVDQRVLVTEDGITFHGDDAQSLRYPVPGPDATVYPAAGARWPLTWDRAADVIRIEDPDTGWVRAFAAGGAVRHRAAGGAVRPLAELADRNGHRLTVRHDESGHPVEVRHSGGHRVAVDRTGAADDTRVTGLRVLAGDAPMAAAVTVRRFGYDESGRLTSITDHTGVPYRYEYDEANRITAWIDRFGSRYAYEYDAEGRAVRGTGPAGHLSSTVGYDPARRRSTVTDSLGHTTEYHHDEHRRVVRVVDPAGAVTGTERDRRGRVVAETDPLGATTRYHRDERGHPTRVELPGGAVVTAEYNELGQAVRVVGPDGAEWRYGYDERGNNTSTTDPAGATTGYHYDERGVLTGFTDALGGRTAVAADGHGLVTRITDPMGGTTHYRRDVFGRITETADALGVTTRYGWTVDGLPLWQEEPDGAREQWTYDAAGNAIAHSAPGGFRTGFEYTHFHLPTARTTRDGHRYTFGYDTELRLTTVTDPQGLVWRYEYDPAGRVIAETDFNGRRQTYATDAAGNLVLRTNGAGQEVRYSRDGLGRVTERRSAERTTGYRYDGAGRIVRATTADSVVEIERDPLGRILADRIDGRAVRNELDPLGRRTSRSTPGGQVSRWSYDAAGQPTALDTGAGSLRFGYDGAGRETSRALAGGATLTQGYDAAGRLASQVVLAAGSAVQERRYAYRADGEPLRVDDRLRGSRQYQLDPAGRVAAVRAATWTETYAYDASGNTTWAAGAIPPDRDDTGGPREYAGTLLRRAGRTSYRHDEQGRVVAQTRRTLSGQRRDWTYTWDAEDRLTDVSTPDGAHWRYRYDGLGRRIAKQRLAADGSVAGETRFAWDGNALAEQTTAVAEGPARTTTWDYEPGGYRPAAQTERTGPPADAEQAGYDAAFYAIVTDLVGSPAELVDGGGSIAWRAGTDLWGRLISAGPDRADCPLRFPGQYHDPETGWHYNQNRYYDPETARFTAPDPNGLEAGPNQHAYVSNPVSWSDPLGLTPDPVQPPRKTDAQLLADSQAIHDAVRTGRTEPGASIAHQGMTVATGEFGGRNVYTVSTNRTGQAVRDTAASLGYERVNGKKFTGPNSTDAEQIMLNAHDQGRLPLADGEQGRIAPSRPACGPKRQDCRGRIAGYPDISLIE